LKLKLAASWRTGTRITDGINQDAPETLHWGSVSVTAAGVLLAGRHSVGSHHARLE